ncbi:hypothetical protein FOZ61_005252 [Perkinsus olseni]|uniref:Prolipoprotein diacylglyceryl transferase n=1 Tax=Perkinsus olseni TaxID=32597 RepID=A0A7J6LK00_PEROL|nr:hypothetical protein FOZ61_005252 [Perkinsus olseni]KAF4659617.1 hypothetical protein FOL46_006529 [Perkinsus olseni]
MAIVIDFARPVLFTIFGQPVYGYGLCMALAFLSALFLGDGELRRKGLKIDSSALLLSAMIGGILGSRLHYMLTWNSSSSVSFWDMSTGHSFQGGLLGGIVGTTGYTKLYCKESIGRMLDTLAPLLLIGHAIDLMGSLETPVDRSSAGVLYELCRAACGLPNVLTFAIFPSQPRRSGAGFSTNSHLAVDYDRNVRHQALDNLVTYDVPLTDIFKGFSNINYLVLMTVIPAFKGKIGCFISGDGCYGYPTDVPWAMSFPNGLVPTTMAVHPAPLYEMITSGGVGLILWARRKQREAVTWALISDLFVLLGSTRFFVERYRGHNRLEGVGISQYQVVALCFILAGLILKLAINRGWISSEAENKSKKKARAKLRAEARVPISFDEAFAAFRPIVSRYVECCHTPMVVLIGSRWLISPDRIAAMGAEYRLPQVLKFLPSLMSVTAEFVRPVLFTVFGLKIYVYGLCMATAFMATFSLGQKEITRMQLKIDPSMLLICAMVGGVIGARIHYALTWDHSALFALNTGLSFQGGLIGGIIDTTVYTRYWCHESVGKMLDMLAPLLMLGHAIGKLGCFLSGDGCYGYPTEVPWAMSFPNGLVPTLTPVHPTPLYEMVTSGSVAAVLWSRRKRDAPTWTQTSDMLMLLGLTRFFIEDFRTYEPVEGFSINQYQIVAIGLVLAGAAIHWTLAQPKATPVEASKKDD